MVTLILILMMCVGGFIASEEMYVSDGMEITSVVPASPSEGVLSEGMVIHGVNNNAVNDTASYTKVLNSMHIGDNITFSTDKGTYSVISTENPNNSSKSYIGVRSKEHRIVSPAVSSKYGTLLPWLLTELRELLYLIFLLNFAVGTFNLLPMKPLDGGLILEEFMSYRITEDRRRDFNDTLNWWTRPLPQGSRCWLSRRFNNLLDFLHEHELGEQTVNFVVRSVSYVLLVILLVLILYGMVPGILKMI